MKAIDRAIFQDLLAAQRVKRRLVRDLRYNPDEVAAWDDLEILAVPTKSKNEGLLLIERQGLHVIAYEIVTGLADKRTGRSNPITCDFCLTWQQGSKAGRITFERASDKHTLTYLCCADLACSLHVRNKTPEAIVSRTQLHEDITVEGRIARLELRLDRLINTLELRPVQS